MKKFSICLCQLVASMFFATNAFGWGNATHTHVAWQLGVRHGHLNYDEMYGAVLTDAFNLTLDEKGGFMNDQCHHNFMPFVLGAGTCRQQASAFGLASHNDTWGMDYTAHQNSFTDPGYGYAVVKGQVLAPSIISALIPILMDAGLDSATATSVAMVIAPEFGHDLSETAVDLWLKRTMNPSIGEAMLLAATRRSSHVGHFLAVTYAESLASALNIPLVEARKFIMTAEREYRNQMIQYGRIFMLPEDQAIGALAEFNAAIAQGFIKTLTGVDVTIAPELVAEFILQAVIVVASDYGSELLQTFAYVEGALETNGITTCEGPDGPGKLADISDGKIPAPRLVGNYPNPFNPSTTISYVLPGVTHVTLKVYNMIGEEVVTLVDGVEAAGNKSVRWSAAGLASGVYLYRLQAGSYVSTGRMAFMK